MENLQPNDFLYRIIIGTTNYDLANAPIGWEENVLSWKRDSKYSGIIRSYTLPLKFVKDGKRLLRSQYYRYGIEAFVRIEILELNKNTWIYERIYIGEVDFSKVKDERDFFTCNMLEAGIAKNIKARDSVMYEIDMDVSEAVSVEIPGVGLNDFANSLFGFATGQQGVNYMSIDLRLNRLLSLKFTTQNTYNTQSDDFGNYFLISNIGSIGQLIRINGYVTGEFSDAAKIEIIKKDASNNYVGQYTIYQGSGDSSQFFTIPRLRKYHTVKYNQSFDFNITENIVGARYYVKTTSKVFINNLQYQDIGVKFSMSGSINISYSTITDSLITKFLRPKYVLQQILKKINDDKDVFVRSFLVTNTDSENILIASGNSIRGIAGSKITTSLKDFIKSYGSILGADLGIEGDSVVFETAEYFYNKFVIVADVGIVKSISIEPYKECYYSSIKTGYKDQSYEIEDGKDEYNSTQEWTTPITKLSKVLDLVSIYRADVRGIEQIKTDLLDPEKNTTDNTKDIDVFLVKVNDDLTVKKYANYQNVQGSINPETVYNLDITPKRNLMRNMSLINSFIDNLEGTSIKFQSGFKNTNLAVTDLDGTFIKENQNIEVATTTPQLFKPVMVSFTAKYNKNIQKNIQAVPYGVIQFSYNGNVFKGFIQDVSIDKSKNKEKEFKVLLSPDTNLSFLI